MYGTSARQANLVFCLLCGVVNAQSRHAMDLHARQSSKTFTSLLSSRREELLRRGRQWHRSWWPMQTEVAGLLSMRTKSNSIWNLIALQCGADAAGQWWPAHARAVGEALCWRWFQADAHRQDARAAVCGGGAACLGRGYAMMTMNRFPTCWSWRQGDLRRIETVYLGCSARQRRCQA